MMFHVPQKQKNGSFSVPKSITIGLAVGVKRDKTNKLTSHLLVDIISVRITKKIITTDIYHLSYVYAPKHRLIQALAHNKTVFLLT